MNAREMRRTFFRGLMSGIHVTWPILSFLVGLIVALGAIIGVLEGWALTESIYFAFVSGLTIGYGDIAPATMPGRLLAIVTGICGTLMTALLAGIAVKALTAAQASSEVR